MPLVAVFLQGKSMAQRKHEHDIMKGSRLTASGLLTRREGCDGLPIGVVVTARSTCMDAYRLGYCSSSSYYLKGIKQVGSSMAESSQDSGAQPMPTAAAMRLTYAAS